MVLCFLAEWATRKLCKERSRQHAEGHPLG
jgi:hypothetical protein